MPANTLTALDSAKLQFGSSKLTVKVESSTKFICMSLPVIGDVSTAGRPGMSSLLSIISSRAKRTSSIVNG